MRGLKTKVEAVIGVVLASLAVATPASADCGAGAIQEATYVDGAWVGLEGPLVTTTPSPEGLAWRVAEGAALDHGVVIETFAEPNSNIGSVLVMVPASDRGIAPLFADSDQRVVFTGSVPCDAEPPVAVHEDPIEAFDEPDAEPSTEQSLETAPRAEPERATVVEAVLTPAATRPTPPAWSWMWHHPI